MTRVARGILAVLLALLAAAPAAFAQAQRSYSQAELDQMLAPIALYPDALLSQVLMAATYPVEVADAARWTRDNPGLPGDEAVRAVQDEDWDPSVKSLVAFPQVLQRMNENIAWTRTLGDAFLAQELQVMDTVQDLRRRAEAAGNLQSSEQVRVEQRGESIVLQPASPQVVYVPYYDPLVVYGPWWWPAYQPVAWAPWPGYARPYRPGISVGFWWGRPVGLSVNFFFGDFDWRERRVRVVNVDNHYYRSPVVATRTIVLARGEWQHDPRHRRGVDYRSAEVRQRFLNAQGERRFEQRTQPVQIQAQPQVEPRAERRADHRETRQLQAQPAAAVQAQPVVRPQPEAQRVQAQPQAQPRVERRADAEHARIERREVHHVAPQPAATVQAQPLAQPRAERRPGAEHARTEHRETRQAPPQPAATVQAPPAIRPQAEAPRIQAQPQTQPRVERRADAEHARVERRETRQPPSPPPAATVQAPPVVRPQPSARPQPEAPRIHAQPQVQPAAAVQAPPVVRPQPEARPQPQVRQEQRNERGAKGAERS